MHRTCVRSGSATAALQEPDKGLWSFPGGGLRLGETMADCARREALEETGLRLGGRLPPRVLTAVDCIQRCVASAALRRRHALRAALSPRCCTCTRDRCPS